LHDDIVGLVEAVLENENAIEQEVQDKSHNWYLMRLLPYTSRGQIDGVLLTLIDITKIKETEQRLAELSEIVQSSADAIFRIAPDGTIRTWNQGSEKLFSHTAEYMIGKNISLLTLDEGSQETMAEALDTILKGGKIEHFQMKAVRRSGEEVDVQMSVSPIYNANNELIDASIVLRDFSKQKHAEMEILDAIRRRDQFLAMLSHELRNPIAAIMNSLAVLKTAETTPDRDLAARSVISRQSRQLSKLLDDLLDVSRITHDKINLDLKPIDLVDLANEVVECIESRLSDKNQQLSLEMPQLPVFISGDKTRIIQAQVNLLVNALKYTPQDGHIKYSISVQDEMAVIEVEDDGEGMSAELLQKVFEVFVQADQPLDRNAGGMGLGLPLVKMIATAHSGEINATSDGPGKGSKFTLVFPLLVGMDRTRTAPAAPVVENQNYKPDGQKLMLVEDNDGSREMLSLYLETEGYTVASACNGIDAVKLFGEFQPTICILDIGLPDLDGYEVASRIRRSEFQPQLLVALTGYGQEQDKELVLNAGFDLHIVKPIDPEELISIIAKHLVTIEQGRTTQ
jgi:two-component system CheB/CheR fusion protein